MCELLRQNLSFSLAVREVRLASMLGFSSHFIPFRNFMFLIASDLELRPFI